MIKTFQIINRKLYYFIKYIKLYIYKFLNYKFNPILIYNNNEEHEQLRENKKKDMTTYRIIYLMW